MRLCPLNPCLYLRGPNSATLVTKVIDIWGKKNSWVLLRVSCADHSTIDSEFKLLLPGFLLFPLKLVLTMLNFVIILI